MLRSNQDSLIQSISRLSPPENTVEVHFHLPLSAQHTVEHCRVTPWNSRCFIRDPVFKPAVTVVVRARSTPTCQS